MLMAMSIANGGSGFLYMGMAMYQYLCGLNMADIAVADEEVPNHEVRMLLQEVCICGVSCMESKPCSLCR